jgi:NADH-quinone oxidoreductase subunit G
VQSLNKFQEEVDGPLRGGDPGQRLVEPSQDKPWRYFENPPAAFAPSEHEWLAVPIYHIFGSDELSVLSHGIAQLTPKPYLGINPSDAAQLGFAQGQQILLGDKPVAVKLMPSLPPGVVGVPVGLPGMPAIDLSEKVRLGGVA